ncbi:hypothetical protein ACFOSC_32750 [Streptantibioticus rubrisoli]|uniref:Uncharacterized protein n=1 Tax=Streptantibioticus rubrisoli TaxID=1387313 RepID=A0ABT1P8M2_9ACTN|nr:hypothetical protein [Streptantibioticus rubrisoli]MCQ4041712.1 hypothetical protein [Streptantibioticus rubrisoli]
MRRDNNTPYPAESGLSTEDLAQARERTADEAPPPEAPAYPGEGAPAGAPDMAGTEADEAPQLLASEEADSFRGRWQEIQSRFVDDPREAVHNADALVAEVMQTLATTFAEHKEGLEGQWHRGEQVSTEDLRTALRHYRSFFNRLLTT